MSKRPFDAEPFLSPEERQRFIDKKWQPAADDFFKDKVPSYSRLKESRLANDALDPMGVSESINEMHGVDFLNDVIPQMVQEVKERTKQKNRRLKILDMGAGFGLFNDQIRSRFGKDVTVYGTSISKASAQRRKKALHDGIETGLIPSTEHARDILEKETNRQLNPNDAKWRSILEMEDYPEFDLIIDSSGEMLYSGKVVPDWPDSYLGKVLVAAIRKLNPGGRFYIGRLHPLDTDRMRGSKSWLEAEYGITIKHNPDSRWGSAFVITKPEEKKEVK